MCPSRAGLTATRAGRGLVGHHGLGLSEMHTTGGQRSHPGSTIKLDLAPRHWRAVGDGAYCDLSVLARPCADVGICGLKHRRKRLCGFCSVGSGGGTA
jgi:hypothetical protein